jgi:hypothetical protein
LAVYAWIDKDVGYCQGGLHMTRRWNLLNLQISLHCSFYVSQGWAIYAHQW